MPHETYGQNEGGGFVGQTFEDVLGPVSARYFGSGFRRVSHSTGVLSIDSSTRTTRLQGLGTATYPEDWSLDAAGQARSIHLSSFDAIALTAASIRAAAPLSEAVESMLAKSVRRVRIKAPARAIPVVEGVEIAVNCDQAMPGGDARVKARVGRFVVEVSAEGGREDSIPLDRQLHDAGKAAALGIGRITRETSGDLHAVQPLATAPATMTCVEELAMFGQLSQIAVYAAKGLDRRSVPNLWVRELSLDHEPSALTQDLESNTKITRDRALIIDGTEVTDLALSSTTSSGANAEASFGFRAPAV